MIRGNQKGSGEIRSYQRKTEGTRGSLIENGKSQAKGTYDDDEDPVGVVQAYSRNPCDAES